MQCLLKVYCVKYFRNTVTQIIPSTVHVHRYDSSSPSTLLGPGGVKLHVQGSGALADMYRALISSMDPRSGEQMKVDTSVCLPVGSPPNDDMNKVIGKNIVQFIIFEWESSSQTRVVTYHYAFRHL